VNTFRDSSTQFSLVAAVWTGGLYITTRVTSLWRPVPRSWQNMFTKVLLNLHHVLYRLLHPVSTISHGYSLRPRVHDRVPLILRGLWVLPDRLSHLTDCYFIMCMLFFQAYWQSLYVCDYYVCLFLVSVQLLSDSLWLNGYVMLCNVSWAHCIIRYNVNAVIMPA